MLVLFVLWIVFAAAVGSFASARGREFIVWMGIGLVISPLVAIVILAVIPEGPGVAPVASPPLLGSATASDLLDRVEALFDRGALTAFEHQRLKVLAARELPAPPPAVAAKTDAVQFTRPCPRCGGLIHPQATTCLHCWAKLGKSAA